MGEGMWEQSPLKACSKHLCLFWVEFGKCLLEIFKGVCGGVQDICAAAVRGEIMVCETPGV